jgi:hypothetical protein
MSSPIGVAVIGAGMAAAKAAGRQAAIGFTFRRSPAIAAIRDELELIGTGGKLTGPDLWLRRRGCIELERDGHANISPPAPPACSTSPTATSTASSSTPYRRPSPGRSSRRSDASTRSTRRTVLQALRRSAEGRAPAATS